VISVFFPYYQCGDADRQKEIDLCLRQNAENPHIDNLIVVIDDGCDVPFTTSNMKVLHVDRRVTYKYWVELTQQYCSYGISVLCNSDIYFDDSVIRLNEVLAKPKSFLALSRWELLSGETEKHPNPHWSQDTWAMNVGEQLSNSFLHQLDFPMGVPRCDNKIAYLFAVHGWSVHNPVDYVKSIHAHETQMRTYNKKVDERIMGGVAYVHPGEAIDTPASLDFDVWIRESGSNINSVKINKTLERWRKEAADEALPQTLTELALEPVKSVKATELLEAIRRGKSTDIKAPNFKLIEYSNRVYFNNLFAFQYRVAVDAQAYNSDKAYYTVAGLIPPVLSTYVDEIGVKPSGPADINFWQYPCATEKQAFENHLLLRPGDHIDITHKLVHLYIPLPWATYVDKKQFPESYLLRVKSLINQYKDIAKNNGYSLKVHSVCQHIHWVRMLEKAQWLGITDFYLSHKDSKSDAIQQEMGTNLNLHGWTLIAVNYEAPERSEGMERKPMAERNLLASFIGAHMKHYRDDSRIKLFEAAKACGRDDVFVDLGNEWHFNKVVYEEQVLNREIAAHHIDEHHERTFRYNAILSDSKFSLCPEGAGPNTLRFWESIAVGSIPVLFSKDLAVFEEYPFSDELMRNVVLWEKEIGPELFSFLAALPHSKLNEMSHSLISIYSRVVRLKTFDCFETNAKLSELTAKIKSNEPPKKAINVLYIGASVTAQKNGYRPELNKKLEASGYTVKQTILATGATGSIFGLCNLSTLQIPENEVFDLTVYEYSTGDLNIGLTPLDVMEDVVFESLAFLKTISQKVVLVNNYRSDYENGEGEFVREKHRDAAKLAGVPVIDTYPLFEEMRKSFSEKDWKEIYRDNVHTSPKGSKLVSDHIFENLNLSVLDSPFERGDSNTLKAGFYFPKISGRDIEIYTYPSSGQEFKYFRLKPNETISMKIKGEIWGLISVVGPTSGWVNVKANGTTIQEFCQLDAHCYYERIQPRQFMRNFEEEVELTIQLIDKELDFDNVKQPHKDHEAERELKFSCIMGRDLCVEKVVVTRS
tara:strand:+ start:1877 stop:5005 length:3129 start_codon:yes stop_codon:yes gene_type:complete